MAEEKRRGLGRGLSALLGDPMPLPVAEVPVEIRPSGGVRTLPVEQLQGGRFQPRRTFNEDAIGELAQSIREKGILQPILVRSIGPGAFEIIAGERRWRAAQRAQIHEVPVIVREMDDREALEIALVENLQRQDLTPLEEAEGYRRLMDEFSHTQEELGKVVGKSRSHVANMMRLLALPEEIKTMVDAGELSMGHARALLTMEDPLGVAREIVAKGLNVRQTEKLGGGSGRKEKEERDPDLIALEGELAESLGLKVSIKILGQGGEVTIRYQKEEQLEKLLLRLG